MKRDKSELYQKISAVSSRYPMKDKNEIQEGFKDNTLFELKAVRCDL